MLPWPAKSPDLNPIEQVWGWMAKDIHGKTFKNTKDLEAYVLGLWEKLPENIVLSFISKNPYSKRIYLTKI